MKLPKRIDPDRIKDAIVQIFFKSPYPIELLVGYIDNQVNKLGYTYIAQPVITNQIKGINQVNINLNYIFLNQDKSVKLQINPDKSLVFNIIGNYRGWDSYFATISSVLNTLVSSEIINSFNRVGIRYISEFLNIDILDKVKFSLDNTFASKVETSSSSLKWNDDGLNISLNLASKLPINGIINATGQQINFVSIIDVDVIKKDFNISKCDDFLVNIEECHIKQKQVFFSLLKDDFLKQLNPTY